MLSLNTQLNTIGISSAKGIDLVMQREQIKATLPRGESASSATTAETARKPVAAGKAELTPEQQRQIQDLQQIDRNVRAHEQAHIAAGRGVITSGANFTYTYGPDGKQYAVGGEVGIDTSAEQKPEANIDKGQRIQAAALAPRDPSPQDYSVASVGSQLESKGQSDLVQQRQEERIAADEAAREKRASQGTAAPDSATALDVSATSANPGTEQKTNDTRLLVQNAYATVTDGSASAARVSLFA